MIRRIENSSSTRRRRERLSCLRALTRADAGQSIVELAITAPFLILLIVGIVEVGHYTYQGIEVGNAAHAGVQYGAQSLVTAADTAGMVTAAKADAKEIASLAATASNYCACDSAPGTQFSCTATTTCNASTTDHRLVYVQVVASGTFTPFLRYPGLPSSLSISRKAIQQVSQ